jgi:hypothetical protein
MRWLVITADVVLPGAGLTWDGRPVAGLPLLLALAALAAAALLADEFAGPDGAALLRLAALAAWAAAAVVVAGVRWWQHHRRILDPAQVRALHRAACAAWLRDEPTALGQAWAVVAAAPGEPGAWAFLAQVAQDRGDLRTALRARRRAEHLAEG